MTAALAEQETRTEAAPRRIVVMDAKGARHFIAGARSISMHGGNALYVFGETGCLRGYDCNKWRQVDIFDQSVDTEPPIARIVNDQWRVAKPVAA